MPINILFYKKVISPFTLLLIIFFLFFFMNSTGQTGIHSCGSDIMRQKNFHESPQIKHKNDSIENVLLLSQQKQFQKKKSGGTLPTPQQIYTIPVVVHIIHNNGPENIPDAQVITGIQHLNDAFRNVGVFNPNTGVDVEIEFCLAKQDENGNFTTGINRIVSTLTDITMETDDLNLKNLIRWDPTKYLNIWIVKEITSQSMGSGVAGYAFFPSSHGNPEDGIVNEANYFGSTPDNSKVAVHEMGHYLGLYHTFEGGCANNNCLADGDKVCDTPPDASTSPVACGATVNTCTTDADDISANNPFSPFGSGGIGDQNDMYINYMDYSYQTCQTAFTLGQKNRMIFFITGTRSSLLQSSGCNTPCTNLITAAFNSSAIAINAGTSVSFTNTSSGATNYTWLLNGTAFSTSTNSSYTFNNQGNYSVKLVAENGDPACSQEFIIIISVTCPMNVSFSASATDISPGDNVLFTNTSTGATSYQWYLDGLLQLSTSNFSNTFSTAGGYMVSLIASNGTCSDTTYQYITVGMCNNKEANMWYFGGLAAMDFNSGLPVALTNNALMNLGEGGASIADVNGNLLFYTDGVEVRNKNHTIMPNGTGLMGHQSSTQSATIVQQPGNNNIYYIFTAEVGPYGYPTTQTCRYSIVDMTLDAGNGDIVSGTKNTLITSPIPEKVTAVKHCNGIDIWVITHLWNSNAFEAYLLTASGLSSVPVVSNVGTVHGGSGQNSLGYLKGSIDGSRLATAIFGAGIFEVLDFNNATGIVSNPITLQSPDFHQGAYGVEFSPDGSKLYGSIGDYEYPPPSFYFLYQFDLNAGSSSGILNSMISIGLPSSSYTYMGALQLGPDGKIYVAHSTYANYGNYLGVINLPNALGTLSNYNSTGFYLDGKSCGSGLPNFMSSNFYKGVPSIQGPDTVCNNDVTYSLNGCFNSVIWSFYGQGSILTSSNNFANIHFNVAGTDSLVAEVTSNCGIKKDTLIINVLPFLTLDLGADTVICQGSPFILNVGSGFTSYLWQDGSTDPIYTVNTPGQYSVTVTNGGGCSATDSINVNLPAPLTTLNLGPDVFSCKGGVFILDAGSDFSSYEWQDGSDNQKFTVYLPGKYWVTVSSCGNTISDTITVFWQSNILFSIAKEGDLCSGKSVVLKADPANLLSYIWDDGSFSYTRDVQSPGTYWLVVTDSNGCYNQDSLDVFVTDCNCVLAVPNAFSPNNDGHNDLFVLPGFENCVSIFSIIIFDRWGEKVFESENSDIPWDGTFKGKLLNPAVFVYSINATLNSGEKINKKGNISLIR